MDTHHGICRIEEKSACRFVSVHDPDYRPKGVSACKWAFSHSVMRWWFSHFLGKLSPKRAVLLGCGCLERGNHMLPEVGDVQCLLIACWNWQACHRSEPQGQYWCSIAFELLRYYTDEDKKATLEQQVGVGFVCRALISLRMRNQMNGVYRMFEGEGSDSVAGPHGSEE